MSKTKLRKLEDELKVLHKKYNEKKKEIEDHKKKYYYIMCDGGGYNFKHCGRKFRIGVLQYIQNEWYVEPYSCTGGDYWNTGSVYTICPNCGSKILITDQYLLDRPNLFKEKLYERNNELYVKRVDNLDGLPSL